MKCVNQRQDRAATVPQNCRPSTPPTPPPAFNLVDLCLSSHASTQHSVSAWSARGRAVWRKDHPIILSCINLQKNKRKKEIGSQTGAHR